MSIALDAAVTAVSANSGAQACGVRAGDRIVSVNSAPAHTKQAIVSALTRLVPTPHPLPELRQLNCVFIIRYEDTQFHQDLHDSPPTLGICLFAWLVNDRLTNHTCAHAALVMSWSLALCGQRIKQPMNCSCW